MNRAAEKVYNVLRQEGTQKSVIDIMQTRNELYESINYYQFEEKLDALYSKSNRRRPDKAQPPSGNKLYPTYYKNDEDNMSDTTILQNSTHVIKPKNRLRCQALPPEIPRCVP